LTKIRDWLAFLLLLRIGSLLTSTRKSKILYTKTVYCQPIQKQRATPLQER
jgi:hypothetical protein